MAGFPEWRYDPRNHQQRAGTCSELTPRKGRILFQMTPGTAPASASAMYVGEWSSTNSGFSYFYVYFSGASEITLGVVQKAGGVTSDTWDCTGSLASGTAYEIKIEYDKIINSKYWW